MLANFTFREDKDGVACPYGEHLRRVNTRVMLDPLMRSDGLTERTGSSLTERRCILRPGLHYAPGTRTSPTSDGAAPQLKPVWASKGVSFAECIDAVAGSSLGYGNT